MTYFEVSLRRKFLKTDKILASRELSVTCNQRQGVALGSNGRNSKRISDGAAAGNGNGPPSFKLHARAILKFMGSVADPKSVKVNLTTGTGVDIEWKDGHVSHYPFAFLRDACPCALCDDERAKAGRQPGEKPKGKPGELPMFKGAAKPLSAEGVGKYAIKFHWNDSHDLGIYSWQFLRDVCPCEECKTVGEATRAV